MNRTQNHGLDNENGGIAPWLAVFFGIVLIGIAIYGTYTWQQRKIDKVNSQVAEQASELNAQKKLAQQQVNTNTSQRGVKTIVYTPASNAKVGSPLAVVGEVPGTWSSEASFPVVLKDSSGNVIAKTTAQVLGDWMTDQLVPFSAKLTFTGSPTGNGTLILQKDNPSGISQNDDTVSIPIKF